MLIVCLRCFGAIFAYQTISCVLSKIGGVCNLLSLYYLEPYAIKNIYICLHHQLALYYVTMLEFMKDDNAHNLSEMLVTASLATDCDMRRYACALLFCKRECILDSEILVLKSISRICIGQAEHVWPCTILCSVWMFALRG
jgi:hypothetical protein